MPILETVPANEILLILVDQNDQETGVSEKLEAHHKGLLHRAFSVMVYDEEGKVLIQKRADTKYHSAGLWANSCCGHPYPGEGVLEAAKRRLKEELGFTCALKPVTKILYSLHLENGLYEKELVHVFEGTLFDKTMALNPEEVSFIKWENPEMLRQEAKVNGKNYARWFRLYLLKHFDKVFHRCSHQNAA
jgi:isopentenyl-diphosphate delta-isomerase